MPSQQSVRPGTNHVDRRHRELQQPITGGAGNGPMEQHVELEEGGERLVVDFLWEKQRVVVETDGRETHETPPAFQSDRRRDQFLASAGYRVLRVTWEQIHVERAAVLGRIKNALQT